MDSNSSFGDFAAQNSDELSFTQELKFTEIEESYDLLDEDVRVKSALPFAQLA
jgi:hypothetical protein